MMLNPASCMHNCTFTPLPGRGARILQPADISVPSIDISVPSIDISVPPINTSMPSIPDRNQAPFASLLTFVFQPVPAAVVYWFEVELVSGKKKSEGGTTFASNRTTAAGTEIKGHKGEEGRKGNRPSSMPSVLDSIPSVLNSMPSVSHSMPSVSNGMPTVSSSMPSLLNSMPSVLNSMPCVLNSMPPVFDGFDPDFCPCFLCVCNSISAEPTLRNQWRLFICAVNYFIYFFTHH